MKCYFTFVYFISVSFDSLENYFIYTVSFVQYFCSVFLFICPCNLLYFIRQFNYKKELFPNRANQVNLGKPNSYNNIYPMKTKYCS